MGCPALLCGHAGPLQRMPLKNGQLARQLANSEHSCSMPFCAMSLAPFKPCLQLLTWQLPWAAIDHGTPYEASCVLPKTRADAGLCPMRCTAAARPLEVPQCLRSVSVGSAIALKYRVNCSQLIGLIISGRRPVIPALDALPCLVKPSKQAYEDYCALMG